MFFSPQMQRALEEAKTASDCGEVPVGAVLVYQQQILACAGNRVETLSDPTAHAEMLVIRAAAALLKTPRLIECDLYVTLEPCAMCAAAIGHARIRRLYFGAFDLKMGAVESGTRYFHQPSCHHRPEIYSGIKQHESETLLKQFFHARR
jgi:tRNA(Arg) A34 adenosine deaminase TadA